MFRRSYKTFAYLKKNQVFTKQKQQNINKCLILCYWFKNSQNIFKSLTDFYFLFKLFVRPLYL